MNKLAVFTFLAGMMISFQVNALDMEIPNKVKFEVKVAKTIQDMQRGLMFIKELPENQGMLFDFQKYNSKEIAMWMKNTYIPLDMIFLDCGFKVVDFYQNAVPLSLTSIKSSKKFCYILEVLGGSVQNKSIKVGDRFTIKNM